MLANARTLRIIKSVAATYLLISLQMLPTVLGAEAGHKTPKDSFLKVQVNSVDSLVKEIGSSAKIRAHYADVYHVSPARIMDYFKQNVQITRLKQDYAHTVYCVTSSGVIFTVNETLKEGDKVFALRNGVPVLRWACGNPLTGTLPNIKHLPFCAGTTIFTNSENGNHQAQLTPSHRHNLAQHSKPIPVALSNQAIQKVSPYVSTLPPSPPIPQPFLGGPAQFLVSVDMTVPPHIPLTPFIAGIPLAVMGSKTHKGKPGILTPGGIPGTSPISTPGGQTPTPDLPPIGGTTPEPRPLTFWSIAGTILGISLAVGRRRSLSSSC